ncbi:uridine kinase family protein [Amycolatopsis palatopharyngis]|uniref:uridine kinase family protein n=1 Tax=Amycolatopsis palatopharyngis TaxID=187982 RepID=UPI001FE27EED|nr:uridine kinase [Amycolatopsis palatopharyngis]
MVDLLDPDTTAVVRAVLAAPPRLGATRLLAIDGPSGSGKSTLAGAVCAGLRGAGVSAALVPTDDFATWDDPVGWWPRLAEGVLDEIAAGRPGRYRRMDWSSGVPVLGAWVTVHPPAVLVLEGVSAGRASIRPLLSYLCWLSGPEPAERLARSVARDGEQTRAELRAWQEFERGWFTVDATCTRADKVL